MEQQQRSEAISGNVGAIRLNWVPDFDHQPPIAIVGLEGSESVPVVDRLVRTLLHSRLNQSTDDLLLHTMTGDLRALQKSLAGQKDRSHIFVIDDPASLALAWESSGVEKMPAAIHRAARETAAVCEFASASTAPTMILSAYRSGLFPDQTLDAVAAFCGISPSDAARTAALALVDGGASAPAITLPDQPIIQGALDRIQRPGAIRGWAKQPLSAERVHVQAWCDGAVVADVVAERMRDDLVAHRVGDGRHGFQLDVLAALTAAPREFEVRAVASGAVVGRVIMSRTDAELVGNAN